MLGKRHEIRIRAECDRELVPPGGQRRCTCIQYHQWLLRRSSYDYPDVKLGSGFKIAFDHRFEQKPIRIEAAYIDTGGADIENSPFAIGYEGVDLSISWLVPANPGSDSSIWLGAGYYSGEAVLDAGAFGSIDDGASGLSLGAGADWMPSQGFGFRFEYKILAGMEDFADDKNLALFSAGLVVAFGNERARRTDPQPGGAEAAYGSTPPAPPAPPLSIGQTKRVSAAGATLHQRDGGTAILAAGALVELVSTRTDGGYTWWWVRTGEREGWILQSELEGQAP